ncbi:MAG: carbamoyl-phosphate synthase large subunit [Spirochaetes bacterium]|nr:carbamoyl-phosphate synthase large subunit [Spirochaetota bacterium]
MPRRTDIKKIMVIGSGPIVIGQACEFDYSGTQAVKALKKEGYEVILINSNPATIMTDPELAHRVYIEPITLPYLTRIIETERPDAILPTVGGQTALNAALSLVHAGVLEKYNVELIGAKEHAIKKAEDRKLFKEAMEKIGAAMPRSGIANTLEEALALIESIGLPAILRPSFTLGGSGGGVCYNREEYIAMVTKALTESPTSQVLIDQSILGWKEYELEVMRDTADNVVIICSIENLDPMGVHTGDSITVAPQQTLSDVEYQNMRDLAIKIIREIGVETGGSNIQFAVNPKDGQIMVVEMNPRVSRSSALASKATGFPIAKIAALLSVGYTLDEIANDITQKTPASFEPTIDYVVTKIPRFTFEKFPESSRLLDTQMRSVGEAMAIGRTFPESFQKAMRSLEIGRFGWGGDGNLDMALEILRVGDVSEQRRYLLEKITAPTDNRIFYLREALARDFSIEDIYAKNLIDPWFLTQLKRITDCEKSLIEEYRAHGALAAESLRTAKQFGFHDRQLAYCKCYGTVMRFAAELAPLEAGSSAFMDKMHELNKLLATTESQITSERLVKREIPVYKRVDTCAAEFASFTPYMYSTYETENEADVSARQKVLILGGGPNRIGQGIEFDYCCCHASYALQEIGVESIMVNSNPETVSTDYDTSDRLYFEPLTVEDVMHIYTQEQARGEVKGVILQFGGQTPLKLAKALSERGVKILGTSFESIERAEDRKLFNELIEKLKLKQPRGRMAASLEEALAAAADIGYPVLARPSFVLGGRAMLIVHNEAQLKHYMQTSVEVSRERPVLIDEFLSGALEVDVDAICDGKDVFIAGILEHVEEAGVHSGDSACILPTKHIPETTLAELRRITRAIALELGVVGCINIQFAILPTGVDSQGGGFATPLGNNLNPASPEAGIFVLEVNPRASRTVPFISKAIRVPLAKVATKVMLGQSLVAQGYTKEILPELYHVKEVVLPFKKFAGVDTILGPEMKSTGEVMGIGKTVAEAFYKAQIAAGQKLPDKGKIFVSVNDASKAPLIPALAAAAKAGYTIVATVGTAQELATAGVQSERVNKVHEGRPHIVDSVKSGDIQLIVNIPTDVKTRNDALEIRLAALQYSIPYFTTLEAAREALFGLVEMRGQREQIYAL